jgi:hypothetical protein
MGQVTGDEEMVLTVICRKLETNTVQENENLQLAQRAGNWQYTVVYLAYLDEQSNSCL